MKDMTDKLIMNYGKEKTEKMLSYLDLILERNNYINLTAIKGRDEAVIKHLADSLSVTVLPEYKEAEIIIDIGTGAGFPGVMLAISDPDKNFVLLDSTLKRLKVIDEFTAELGISNITTVHARAEEISKKTEYHEAFDLCVTRAVASMDKLAGWCLPFVKNGKYFIAYKGENYNEELQNSSKALKKYNGITDRIVCYPEEPAELSGHVLVVIKKK